jgi:hypothetical protein
MVAYLPSKCKALHSAGREGRRAVKSTKKKVKKGEGRRKSNGGGFDQSTFRIYHSEALCIIHTCQSQKRTDKNMFTKDPSV